ncbi:hypothetical protein UFOVP276_214 [uncultured Caudovirales phage]|uniref:Uncharacterized protein n=1 Tax=uncultured Caudovirales phage TaxID=2100421 RepID=A0A6J5LKX8_9CAUD|nr:hypothetical protein UFOVP127_108 [uncultured Caudovirales phage]CAB4135258.1 hypothetical protein UFOVP276_214 [uncultured Caudovirales phage]
MFTFLKTLGFITTVRKMLVEVLIAICVALLLGYIVESCRRTTPSGGVERHLKALWKGSPSPVDAGIREQCPGSHK